MGYEWLFYFFLLFLFVGHGVGLDVSFDNIYIWKVIREEAETFDSTKVYASTDEILR
jgi:hypothetical protein